MRRDEEEIDTHPTQPPQMEKMTEAKDILTLYMRNLETMSKSINEEQYYRCVLQSINLGKALLSNEHSELKQKATQMLLNKLNYPHKRQMTLTESSSPKPYYRMGSSETGAITVRPEEIDVGNQEAINQQCNEIVPRLKEIEIIIFETLIKDKVIKGKPIDLEEIILEQALVMFKEEYDVDVK